jgi:fimbrial isopeptide formation D2 family protein
MPDVVDWKTVDPTSGTAVVAGKTLTYTLHFTNRGTADGTVDKVDDITHVADDATVVSQPTSSDPALTVTPFAADNRATITGTLAAGQTVTVTYQVTVNDPDSGDSVLANFLLKPGDPTPTDPTCAPADEQLPDCTSNPVGVLEVTKTVDPANFSDVQGGDTLTYTLTFHNTGKGSAEVDYTDHMAGVLDDATLTSAPKATDAALVASGITGGEFTVTGTLEGGQTIRVTYKVKVKAYDEQADHKLDNFLAPSGPFEVDACVSTDPMCTQNPIPAPQSGNTGGGTASTGGNWRGEIILGGLLLGGGLLLVLMGRRNRRRIA